MENKTILILGASSDIGMKYIEYLKENEQNITVIAHYRTLSESFQKQITTCNNIKIVPLQADLSVQEEVIQLITKINAYHLTPSHILFLPAPRFAYMKIAEYDDKKAKESMQIQVFSFQEILKAFLPNMEKEHFGKIAVMLTAYIYGEPPKYMVDYIVSKYALLGLVKAVASEYGDKGININGISPNMIDTKFVKGIGRKVREIAAESNPRHRNLLPDDVIPAIDYLLSKKSDFMNGCTLNLSGRTN